MAEPKKLYRDPSRAMIGGVCAGLADYMGVDATIVRVVTVLIAIFTMFFPTVIAYVLLWIIIPPTPGAAGAASPPPQLQQQP